MPTDELRLAGGSWKYLAFYATSATIFVGAEVIFGIFPLLSIGFDLTNHDPSDLYVWSLLNAACVAIVILISWRYIAKKGSIIYAANSKLIFVSPLIWRATRDQISCVAVETRDGRQILVIRRSVGLMRTLKINQGAFSEDISEIERRIRGWLAL